MSSLPTKNKGKKQRQPWIPLLVLACLLLFLTISGALLLTPGASRPSVGQGELSLAVKNGGNLEITLPPSQDGAAYILYYRQEGQTQFTRAGQYHSGVVVLQGGGIDLTRPLEIKLQAVSFGKNLLGMSKELKSRDFLTATVEPASLSAPELFCTPSQDRQAALQWTADGTSAYQVCVLDSSGKYTPVVQTEEGSVFLHFGPEGELDMPPYDRPVSLAVRAVRQGEGYVLYGPFSQSVAVERGSLLGSQLYVDYDETDERIYTLRWDETKASYYEVQEWSESRQLWETLARIDQGGELAYETGRLASGSSHRFRVAAYGGDSPEEGFENSFAEITLQASVSPLYCSVWPVEDLTLCSDAGLTTSLASVPAGTMLCVMREEGDTFYVRCNDLYGYIDARFCMINLPEYLGDWCAYDITNSYRSLISANGRPLLGVTSRVVEGYGNVRSADGSFLVPLLYPSAKNLLLAAQAAQADGYRLKIYDAFRPDTAASYLYGTVEEQLDDPAPVPDGSGGYIHPATGMAVDGTTGLLLDDVTGTLLEVDAALKLKAERDAAAAAEAEQETADDAGAQSGAAQTAPDAPAKDGAAEDGPEQTYREIMTDGHFDLDSFLGASCSHHGQGLALDLTLEDLEKRTEHDMQTTVHDLSHYSAASLNNKHGQRLEKYMTDAGFQSSDAMWWHFEDGGIRDKLKLTSCLEGGVSSEGWVRDDSGWRYRIANGNFFKNTTITVNGVKYSLDGDGYVVKTMTER